MENLLKLESMSEMMTTIGFEESAHMNQRHPFRQIFKFLFFFGPWLITLEWRKISRLKNREKTSHSCFRGVAIEILSQSLYFCGNTDINSNKFKPFWQVLTYFDKSWHIWTISDRFKKFTGQNIQRRRRLGNQEKPTSRACRTGPEDKNCIFSILWGGRWTIEYLILRCLTFSSLMLDNPLLSTLDLDENCSPHGVKFELMWNHRRGIFFSEGGGQKDPLECWIFFRG